MPNGEARTELFKPAVRKIVEEGLEAELSDVLGEGYYEPGAEPGRGYRNGPTPSAPPPSSARAIGRPEP